MWKEPAREWATKTKTIEIPRLPKIQMQLDGTPKFVPQPSVESFERLIVPSCQGTYPTSQARYLQMQKDKAA